MDMQGKRQLGVTQQQAWDALNDPDVLKTSLKGCDKFEATEDGQYAVSMAVKVGPVSAKFNGKVTLSEIEAPQRYKLAFEGQGGVAGFGKGASQVSLSPLPDDPDAGCELAYTVQAQVGGKIAQLGQRLVDGAAKSMADDFFKRFDAEMQRRYGVSPPTDEATEGEANSGNGQSGATETGANPAQLAGGVAPESSNAAIEKRAPAVDGTGGVAGFMQKMGFRKKAPLDPASIDRSDGNPGLGDAGDAADGQDSGDGDNASADDRGGTSGPPAS